MQGEPIRPFDWHRMFLGDAPWWFAGEVVFRTVFIYAYSLLLLRLLSRRAVGQLSLIEFLLVIALGSAIGDGMFYPDVPIVHCLVVITMVILLNRGINLIASWSDRVETVVSGQPIQLVREGLMLPQELARAQFGPEELYELLRLEGVEHLGQVRTAFLEASGRVSVYRFEPDEERPGVRICPPWNIDKPETYDEGDGLEKTDRPLGCQSCGRVETFAHAVVLPRCPNCNGRHWPDAVTNEQPGSRSEKRA